MSHVTRQPPLNTVGSARNTAAFGQISTGEPGRSQDPPDFTAIAHSTEFRELRYRLLRFVFPMSAVFLLWYLAYVVVAAWMPEFMGTRVLGEINAGMLMGVGQFASTIIITAWYQRFASRQIDPRVAELRQGVTGGEIQ